MSQTTDLTVFTGPSGEKLRVILQDDQPWFIASDVCAALDITNARDAVSSLDDDERGVVSTDTPGGRQRKTAVTEPGLYSLIMRSRKAEAKQFKRWVTHDVLPTLRRTGQYAVPGAEILPTSFAEALELAAKQARTLEATQNALLAANEVLETTEAIVGRMTASQGCLSLGQAAQVLGFGRQTFINHLQRLGLVMNKPGTLDHLRPYQQHLRAGRYEVEAQTYTKGEGEDAVDVTTSRTRITPKGLTHVAQLLQSESKLPPRGRTWYRETARAQLLGKTTEKESR